jgi:hypothetical protein
MNQMLTEIRRAESILCAPTNDSIIVTRPHPARLPDEEWREYKYNPEAKRITLQVFYKDANGFTSSGPVYTLASNMETARFGPPERIRDTTGQTGEWLEVRVPVTLEVKIGSNSIRLSGSSSPRRAAQR